MTLTRAPDDSNRPAVLGVRGCRGQCNAQLLPESAGVERKRKFVGLRPLEAALRDFQPEVVVVVALGRKKCSLFPVLLGSDAFKSPLPAKMVPTFGIWCFYCLSMLLIV